MLARSGAGDDETNGFGFNFFGAVIALATVLCSAIGAIRVGFGVGTGVAVGVGVAVGAGVGEGATSGLMLRVAVGFGVGRAFADFFGTTAPSPTANAPCAR